MPALLGSSDSYKGFTLIETLIAAVILFLSVAVLSELVGMATNKAYRLRKAIVRTEEVLTALCTTANRGSEEKRFVEGKIEKGDEVYCFKVATTTQNGQIVYLPEVYLEGSRNLSQQSQ